jgi:hypothetical protein
MSDLRPALQMPPAIVGSPGSSWSHPRWEEQNPASSCRAAERTTGSRLDHNGGNHVKFGCPAAWVSAPREHSQTVSQPCHRIHTIMSRNTNCGLWGVAVPCVKSFNTATNYEAASKYPALQRKQQATALESSVNNRLYDVCGQSPWLQTEVPASIPGA